MATISTNVYDNSKFELRITPTADNANLRYKLSWEIWLVISGGNWWEYNAIRINNAKINGTQVKGSETFSYYYGPGSWKLASGTTYVAYNSDGSDVKVSASISGWFYADGDVSGSGTVTCTGGGVKPTTNAMTAPSTAVISETSSTISVTWNKMSSYNNAGTYTLQVSQNGSAYADVTTISAIGTLSYSYSIPNKGQGTTYRFRIRANNNIGSGDWQYSGTVTINSLSPPTIGTLGTFNPYVNTTFNVPLSGGSQANGGGFKRCANIHVDGNYKYAGTAPSSNGNTSVNITVSAANILADLGANSYSSSTKFTIVAWTENANGTRSSYVSKSFTVNINSDGGATPSIGTISVSGGALNNPATCFISGITTMAVSVSSVATRRGHANTTVSCKINYDSTNKNGTSASFASNTTGVRTITVTATDSRGLSSSKTYQVRVQSWAKPTIKITSVERLADPNTSATLNYSISYSPIYQYTDVNTAGNQLNGITSQQYNLNGGSWATASNGMTITGLSTELAYTVNVRCNDKVSTSSYGTNNGTVPSIQVELSIRKGRVGINGVPQSGFVFESYGKTRVHDDDFIVTNASKLSQADGKTGVVIHSSGGIELCHESTPYIDFHYANSTSDYTSRIIEIASGVLKLYNNLEVVSSLTSPTINGTNFTGNTFNATTVNTKNVFHEGYTTENTADTKSGYWYMVGTLKATGRYENSTGIFEIMSHGDGSGGFEHGFIYARLKQQNAMGEEPYYSCMLSSESNMNPSAIWFGQTVGSSTLTEIQLWVKIDTAYRSHQIRMVNRQGNVTINTNPTLQASLPTAIRRVNASFKGSNVLTGFSARQSEITWGTLKPANGYSYIARMDTANGGSVAFADANGQTNMQIDGYFYQREGKTRVADLEDLVSSPLLWSGSASFMTNDQSVNLSQAVSAQKNGVVLVWSYYSSGALNYDWNYTFISKRHISNHAGTGINCTCSVSNSSGSFTGVNKYVYLYDTKIKGYTGNSASTASRYLVLRYVYGF